MIQPTQESFESLASFQERKIQQAAVVLIQQIEGDVTWLVRLG